MVARKTGTHRSERLPARGGASENDIGIVILVYTEETLKRRFISKTARQLESAVRLVIGIKTVIKLIIVYVQLLYSEWLDVFSARNEGQQMTQWSSARLSTDDYSIELERHT